MVQREAKDGVHIIVAVFTRALVIDQTCHRSGDITGEGRERENIQ